jgi:hypothetical protein
LLKITEKRLEMVTCFFRMTVRTSNLGTPCTHAASDGLINVKSRNALLLMLLICICSYLKSLLRYKFSILDSLYLREQGCEDPWLFFEAKRAPRAKKGLGSTALNYTRTQFSSHLPPR